MTSEGVKTLDRRILCFCYSCTEMFIERDKAKTMCIGVVVKTYLKMTNETKT